MDEGAGRGDFTGVDLRGDLKREILGEPPVVSGLRAGDFESAMGEDGHDGSPLGLKMDGLIRLEG